MYDKKLETDREAKRKHDDSLKKAASARLAANAEGRKRMKKAKKEAAA